MATQTTINTAAPQTYLNKVFYDRKLLEIAKTKFVYANFGQKRPIPKNNGKTAEFRKFNLFTPDLVTNKLTEGVTPASQAISQSKVEATVDQYGAYVEVSDLLDMTSYDPLTGNMVELLGEQMGTLLDWITRNAMAAGASDQFAGGRASAAALTATDKLTIEEVRKAVRTLKKNKARMFTNGKREHFICVCDPDATFDLQSDPVWQDVSKYSNAEAIYSGEIGRMFGVVFVESTEAPIDLKTATNPVNANVDVHHSMVFGQDAYGCIDIDGSGAVETIIKPRGSAGASDPLDQRGTIGAKIAAYTAVTLNPLWIIDVQHAVTA
jgi:N4-gp56 family major capsid protein